MKTMPKQFKPAGQGAMAFTLIELLMVISIIGIVAALTVAAMGAAKGKKDEAAVKTHHAKLVLAIESYKKQFGTYPLTPPGLAATNAHWNALAYELGGVRPSGVNFVSELDPTHTITTTGPAQLNGYFGLAGLVNVSASPSARAKSFLSGSGGSGLSATYVYLTNGTPGLPAAMFLQVPADHPSQSVNLWRYRVYPTNGHNPKSFDLWAEWKKRGGGTNTYGNWK